ncbi:MAG: hypothetical protein HOP19_23460 [Acidobacteria bacterium]|nr:hypothetical protein [Acidobacteriota bacterium]
MKTNETKSNQQIEVNELTPELTELSVEETQNIQGGATVGDPSTTPGTPNLKNLLKPGAIRGLICWY